MCSNNPLSRAAVSLVEVIFAMGVILIGILGVMSILPLAGRRAQDSVSLSVGAAMGDSVASEILAHRWLKTHRLRFIKDANTLSSELGSDFRIDYTAPVSPFCIDPLLTSTEGKVVANAYDTTFFPFFNPRHAPLLDPSSAGSLVLPNLPLRRMVRVGVLRNRIEAHPHPVDVMASANPLLTPGEALQAVERRDDLLFVRPKDRTKSAFMSGNRLTSGVLDYAARFPSGEFTWIATVNPERGERYATLSIVILRKRARMLDIPTGPSAAPIPEKNAISERIAIVTMSSGFSGGAGGMTTIASNSNTVPRVRAGEWVMLSSFNNHTGDLMPVHRWYRIAAIAGDAVINTATGTWTRELHLDGPDWDFANPTFVTLLDGVVSVTNHFVRLDEL